MRNQIVKVQADGLIFGLVAALKMASCDESQPESALCYALNKVVEESAKDFASSTGNLFLNALLY